MNKIKYIRSPKPRTSMYQFDPWDLDHDGFKEVVAWCVAEYGRSGHRWTFNKLPVGSEPASSWGRVLFRDEADAFHFFLRWG